MTAFVVGLTGGIGSGKSAAADRFAALGAAIVDTDRIAHQLTGPEGAAMPALVEAFGEAIRTADGALDRPAMRARVFADPAERQRLEGILHPLIRTESDRQVAAAQAGGSPYILLVVPLLIESGNYRARTARIAVVDCPTAVQIARVMQRSGLAYDEVERILAAQATRARRIAAADDVIDNGGSLVEMQHRVDALDRSYRSNTGVFSGNG